MSDFSGKYMVYLVDALTSSLRTQTNQQAADTISTSMMAKFESAVSNYWNNPTYVFNGLTPTQGYLAWASHVIQLLVLEYQKNQSSTILPQEITAAQNQYGQLNAEAQASTNNADSNVQTMQSQNSQDSNNQQNLLQLVSSFNQLNSALASLLSK